MFLDDLFNQAATDSGTPHGQILVEAAVTTNQTGGFKSNTNKDSATPSVNLLYTPETIIRGPRGSEEFVPAKFSGGTNPSITITAPIPILPSSTYKVEILGTSFIPTVDAATSVVYGAAGSVFVTISLCGYVKQPIIT